MSKASQSEVLPMTAEDYRAAFVALLLDRIKANELRVEEFRKRLSKDAYEALEWSAETFRVAARLHVERAIVSALGKAWEGPVGLRAFAARVHQEAMRGARYPSHSTSAPANYATECRTAAWAEYAEDLDALAADTEAK